MRIKKQSVARAVFAAILALTLMIPGAEMNVSARAEAIPEGENLLENGSFEELDGDGLPEGWFTDAYINEAGYTVFSVSEENAREGNRAAAIRNIGDNDARFAQIVEVEPESVYRFSGYIRTENVEGGRGANLSIEGLYVFSESVFDTSDGWEYIEWYGETGEDQEIAVLFARLGGYSGESRGKAWFDDLRLEKVSAVPGDMIADRWYSQRTVSYYDEEEEPEENSASAAWPRLIMISLAYSLIAALLIQWLRRKEKDARGRESGKNLRILFWGGMALALALRLAISYHITGYMVDVNCFTSWGNTMADAGPAGFYPETNFCDYPPAYTYILGLNALICRAIPGISEGMTRVVYRFFPAVCDLLAVYGLDRFLRRRGDRKPAPDGAGALEQTAAMLMLAFHPVSILNCAAWGQMDSALAALLLMVAVWAMEDRWEWSLGCYMLAVLVKPQALMLGFLGLAAVILRWVQAPAVRKRILRGLGLAAAVLLIVVVPFSLRQDPFWIIGQYAKTLSSYPYATVNTANYYYLWNGNWNKIENAASLWASAGLALLTAAYGAVLWRKGRGIWRRLWIEEILCGLFTGWFVYCALTGANWAYIGTAAMAFAFVIVLGLFIRKGELSFLPWMGGLLFLLLYVFGVKMHERYIFPAFLLMTLAVCLCRDRRMLIALLTVTCTSFVNEGIVLDNSIRLGSSLGHLNQDTYVLAMLLAAVNVAAAVWAVWISLDSSLAEEGERHELPRLFLESEIRDNRLHWKKADTLALCLILGVYSLVSFSTLGSLRAPQTAWTSTEYTEKVILDLGEERESFLMLYFARVSRNDFSVSVSRDGEIWEEETWAQMDQGQCWKWKYVTDSTGTEDGSRSYGNARHWFSGRYVRITAQQINLALCEVLFRDEKGCRIPIASVKREGGDPESEIYSAPELLCDEQDSMEAMPVWFPANAKDAEDEENPAVAQPSWWNSTYFDEIYHARTAWEFLTGGVPYETSHPPLGKILISWGIALFGMTPFGWRFAGAVTGVMMLAVIYLVAKQMTKHTGCAAFACGLFALDCMHLTQTQIATIDSYPVLFILCAFFFMLRFLQTDWRKEKQSRVLADLGLSGLSMGLAIASKWIGIYAGAGLAVLFFWHGIRVIRENRKERNNAFRAFLRICLWCVPFFVLIPLAVYLLSYIPYFAYRHFTHPGDYLQAVLNSQQGMLSYHSTPGLGMDHPFYSPWYEWPIIGKPMFYSTKQYIFNDELSFSIFCFGNPVIWWLGIPAMLLTAWAWIRNRAERTLSAADPSAGEGFQPCSLDTSLVFLLIGFLAQYLPWTLVPRGTYIYHYFASVPFLILALTLISDQIRLRAPRTGKAGMIALSVLALGAMILFFPYASGIMSPVGWLDLGKGLLKIWY